MKYLVMFVLIFSVVLNVTAASDTNRLVLLQKEYQRQIDAAAAPINRTYLTNLEALKKDLGAKGDITAAVLVQKEIERLQESMPKMPGQMVKADKYIGKWKWHVGVVEVTADHTIVWGDNTYQYREIGKDKISFVFGHWGVHEVTFSNDTCAIENMGSGDQKKGSRVK